MAIRVSRVYPRTRGEWGYLIPFSPWKAPIKIRGFIFTHASGSVPRHAVLGVGVSNEVRARVRPRAMRALARVGSRAA